MAANTPPTHVQRVHPGGFFWTVQRADRLAHIARFVAQTRQLAIIASSDAEVSSHAERLKLSGVPVHQAMSDSPSSVLETYLAEPATTLIAPHEYLVENGPVPVPMAVHLRAARSVRQYAKRLDALPAAVHLTFVIPEDDQRASSLQAHFEHDEGHGGPSDVTVTDVILSLIHI